MDFTGIAARISWASPLSNVISIVFVFLMSPTHQNPHTARNCADNTTRGWRVVSRAAVAAWMTGDRSVPTSYWGKTRTNGQQVDKIFSATSGNHAV